MSIVRNICIPLLLLVALTLHADDRPNIILIMADDLGYETIGANGGQSYKTPVLDRLAAEGVRFTHAYSQPICTPSRVQIMTGIYNQRNYAHFGVLPRSQATFAHLLRDAGYATCIAGKWQLGRELDSPQHFGFQQSLLWQQSNGRTDPEGNDTRFENPLLQKNGELIQYTNGEFGPDLINEFIRDFIGEERDGPFLVYYPMILTHCPFVPTPDHPDYDPASVGSPTYKGDPWHFDEFVHYMDKLIGQIVETLEATGQLDNTLLIFTGDNGTDEPIVSLLGQDRIVAGGKGKTTDAGTHVPFIAYGPDLIEEGLVLDDLLDFSDILPTFCDLAGVEVPPRLNIDGRSFLPQLKGQRGQPREWIYCWYSRNGNWEGAQAFVRNQRYKLYDDGRFYDITKDPLEALPLAYEDLTRQQQALWKEFKQVLDQQSSQRGESLPPDHFVNTSNY